MESLRSREELNREILVTKHFQDLDGCETITFKSSV